ncbi:hypothetical protein H6G96_21290 [Nostoc sp. FACHB-892]|uniref:hypothetical protein n=1 Tax=Nostoc sp. FACHB-892 TaxID=2692843 RepID=UPI001689E0D7|nr:hypothetical protein [Nostoc sp. FACHB-892]MBD2728787.1 hypothetical protein [Nostoc sp. FACHB-892]
MTQIQEYWIVYPLTSKVTVLILIEELYEPTDFVGTERIQYQISPELELIVEQVLRAED